MFTPPTSPERTVTGKAAFTLPAVAVISARPGVMASIAKRMADQEISLESVVQRRPKKALPGIGATPVPGTPTAVVIITHDTTEAAIRKALDAIEGDGKVSETPQMIRIEKL